MEALHDFLQQHPGVDLAPFLAGANDRLRTYFYEASHAHTRLPVQHSDTPPVQHRCIEVCHLPPVIGLSRG